MLMQSVDFLELNRRHNVTLQMGGSDQWGNIVSGVDLVRRVDRKAAFGLTTPLLTTASGGKMGKTAQGAIWLNSDQLSPYDYWQFWRNADDADVGKFLKLFTDLPLDEITRLEALEGAEINDAKKALADAATTMLHGGGEARKARATSEKAFELGLATADLPTRQLLWVGTTEEQERNEGKAFDRRSAEALLKASELSPSLGQARKKIQNEGVWINDELVRDPSRTFGRNEADAVVSAFRIRLGKHGRIVLVKPV
jgi:tyrosyl-tRNA synthetase